MRQPWGQPARLPSASDFAEEDEDEHDHQDETEAAARPVAPLVAMRPSGQGTDEHEDDDDEQNGGDGHTPSSGQPGSLAVSY